MSAHVRRYDRRPAGLGPLYVGDDHGQLVAEILEERREFVGFDLVRSEVRKSGRRALAMPAARGAR